MAIAAGTHLGRYEIRSLIGQGGMGEVYLAWDSKLERTVALKILPADVAADPRRMRRFTQEAKAASALSHPNVAHIYEIEEVDGYHFIAMEYVEGETLRRHLARSRMKLSELLDVAIQIASALSAAHAAGIVHRDIKPENIMVRRDGLVKVLDFGLVKLTRSQASPADPEAPTQAPVGTDPGVVMGTAYYMSPEQARGLEVDARTDVWSLGCVLYEMVTGRLPFEGPTSSDVLSLVLTREPQSLRFFTASAPERLDEIVTKALAKDREERYQSVKDLLIDLKRLKQRLDVEAEIERSVPPEVTAGGGSARTSLGRAPVETPQGARGHTAAVERAHSTSSAEYLIGGIRSHQKGAAFAVVGLTALVGLLLLFWLRSPLQKPRVTGYRQITRDGQPKLNTVTDGLRLYFSKVINDSNGNTILAQVPITGGETVPLPTTIPNPRVTDISPNGSELLLVSRSFADWECPLWSMPVTGGSPRRLGDLRAHDAAWLPDGQRVVYTSGSGLFVAKSDGTEPRKLATVEGQTFWPRWSPDGARLRFSVQDPKTDSSALWEVAADGSDLHPLLPGWQSPHAECCGSWTPDGGYYVFQSSRDKITNLWAMREKSGWLERTQHEPVQLTSGPIYFSGAIPGKDGKRFFVLGSQPRGELVRYDAKSGHVVSYLSGISAEGVEFSRDGAWVAYTTYPEGTLWRGKADGTERLQLSLEPMRAALPRWSPDGKRIAFMGMLPGRAWKTYLVSAAGGTPEQLLPGERDDADASWSPDGNSLVFSRHPHSEEGASEPMTIDIVDLRTKEVSVLPGSEGLVSPRWSPDGQYIVAMDRDLKRLTLFDRRSGKWEEVARGDHPYTYGYPNWSRDGKYIYVELFFNDPGILRIKRDNHQAERVVSVKNLRIANGVLGAWMGLAPDDSPLLMRDLGSSDIYALDWQAP